MHIQQYSTCIELYLGEHIRGGGGGCHVDRLYAERSTLRFVHPGRQLLCIEQSPPNDTYSPLVETAAYVVIRCRKGKSPDVFICVNRECGVRCGR